MRIEDLIKLKPTNDYQKNYSNEQIMKQSRCLSPVQSLDEKGYEFSIIDGKLKVFVKERISIMDGFSNDWYEEDELNETKLAHLNRKIEEIKQNINNNSKQIENKILNNDLLIDQLKKVI